jgi:glycerophosphoryl diester phosphodiesterase
VIEPSRFDCTADPKPPRSNKVPIACATDVGCTTRLVIAHRSAGGQLGVIAPENSLAAIRAAIVMGADFIETDPRATKDGVLINMHDPTVDRTTEGSGEVAKMTLTEIHKLRLKSDKFAGDFSCERVPTIKDVLLAARGKIHVLLDANKTDQAQIKQLVDLVRETDTLDWAIFDTDSVEKIDAALSLEPKLHTMIRVVDEKELSSELAHFASHPPIIVEVHDTPSPKSVVSAIHMAKHRASVDVFPIDVAANLNPTASLYADAFASGADMVQSDRPDLVLKFLGRWTLP